jgi:cephalosporin-C deacetylase-like acetyl esterase
MKRSNLKDKLKTRKLFINDIPVLECSIDDNSKKNLLILSHGFTGNKENWTDKMDQLAQMGFYTVALDNRYHGERKGISFKEKIMTPDGHLDLVVLRKTMNETALDISTLIDHYVMDKTINASEIGMLGISMGGFVTYASLIREKRITFAVPIISSPFWDDIPEDTNVVNTEIAVKEFKEYAVKNSPANQYEKFYPRKIFALIGTQDKHFKAERVIDFYDKLKINYGANNKNIKINQYSIGHGVTDKMWNDVLKWLKEEILDKE